MKTTSYLEEPNRHFLSALHAKNDTTNLFGYKLCESTENNKGNNLNFSGSILVITLFFAKL